MRKLLDERMLEPGAVVLLGIPLDENASFLRGSALAPGRVREALLCGSSNLCTEGGLDLSQEPRWYDGGDLAFSSSEGAFQEIEAAVARLLDRGAKVLALGGDHSVALPILRAYAARYRPLQILQLDAHPDLYDAFAGKRFSHACPFARLLEEHPQVRLVQVGIRTMNPHQRTQADRFGVEVHEMWDGDPLAQLKLEGPWYLSLDLDVLDPSCAPGVSHPEPGGFTTREVLRLIQTLPGPVIGADLVELNPLRDPQGLTACVAAKLVKEMVARMLESPRDRGGRGGGGCPSECA
jgi:agmatinase